MKSVLISIHPKWCELIAEGKKTVEVRKTAPKLETPFKCYIYMTKKGNKSIEVREYETGTAVIETDYKMAGKVVGEFVCDKIDEYKYNTIDGVDIDDDTLLEAMLDWEEINVYAKGKTLYGWHISDLKIYDTPKWLREFFVKGTCEEELCSICKHYYGGNEWSGSEPDCDSYGLKPVTRPPQSWCYVEV